MKNERGMKQREKEEVTERKKESKNEIKTRNH
jgi:hypothetical protein